ncbi:MAG TPA: hypothetical protein VJN88_01535 [Ktedonobacterales bacterium]|nr:hypothetical protein [Ktedonobacterales bacterium]
MRFVQRMVGAVGVLLFAAGMVVTVMVMPMITVDVLVRVVSLAVVDVSRR